MREKFMVRNNLLEWWEKLVVVWMFVTPLPVIALLFAVILAEGDIEIGVVVAISLVRTGFIVIPVVIVLVIAIVNANGNLRRRTGLRCHRSHKRGCQKQSS